MIPEAREVRLKPKIRKVLESRCRAPSTPQRDVKRARIMLLAAEGRSTRSIAEEVGVQPRIVSNWRRRFAEHGLGGLKDLPRGGKKPIYGKDTDKRILALLDKPPPQGYARWTGPLLAKVLDDVDVQYVWRFLREHNIDLVVRKSWCESNDPSFVAKAADVVGLYVDPPNKAIVLCVDEKPSIQALERAQGYLKLPNGRALTGQSHDYKRHGTTTLFAALEVATGRILAAHSKRRRRVEFLGFMNSVVAVFPGRELHVILDNLNTHKKNERWLKKHPKVHFHFIPTQSSWLNQIETWFSILQGQSLNCLYYRRAIAGAHRCVHRSIQRDCRAIRLDQEKVPPAPVQKSPNHSTLIPGTRSGKAMFIPGPALKQLFLIVVSIAPSRGLSGPIRILE
jgi:transposase